MDIFFPDLIRKNTTPVCFVVSYKMFQGYKLNIFCPDLIENTSEYFLVSYKVVQGYKLDIFCPDLIKNNTQHVLW
jgi:hypothetical protein